MPYVTVMQTPRTHQITLDEILSGEIPIAAFSQREATGTVTHFVKCVKGSILDKTDFARMIGVLDAFVQEYKPLYEADRSSLYNTFYIPKRSGGLRKINAPNEELMEALRKLKRILESDFGALYHTSAYAYVRGRCTVDAVKKHQSNASRWFLKTDFSDFFGSTTKNFLIEMLSQIFPFNVIMVSERGRNLLEQALDLCFLDGGLPQGTPISPMLTNLMMIPIDHALCNELRESGFVYTRYADDILISHQYDFSFKEKCEYVNSVLARFNAPFKIKPSKTRYGSRSGANWNLGVMLNKENQITIGHKKKKLFEAMCNNYIVNKLNQIHWDRHDLQVFAGLISYYKMIEPENINRIIWQYNRKYNVNMMALLREDLR